MKIVGYGLTDVGTVREQNQDAFLVDNELGIWLVCDGMGGHAAGDIAARSTVSAVGRIIKDRKKLFADEWEEAADAFMISVLNAAVQEANTHLAIQTDQNPALRGMGTTVTMLVRFGQRFAMGHVGDSRLYLSRRGELHQLSTDHTLMADLLRQGTIRAEDAKNSPFKHVLSRVVGQQEAVRCDTLFIDPLPGDRFLLCSDGLSNALAEGEQLAMLMAAKKASDLPKSLIDKANELDGSDNATAVVVWVQDEAITEKDRKRTEVVNLKIETLRQMFLFSDLSLQEVLLAMENVTLVDAPPGSALIREAESGDSLFIILSGACVVTRGGQEVARLSAGSHFGDMALLNESPRSATVTTTEECCLLKMKRESFVKFLRQESEIGVKILWKLGNELARRLESANLELYGTTA